MKLVSAKLIGIDGKEIENYHLKENYFKRTIWQWLLRKPKLIKGYSIIVHATETRAVNASFCQQ